MSIHGAKLEHQPKEFQEEFELFNEKVKDRVMLRGSYRQADIEALMMEADLTVIPSIWWENSPVVIQEAFFYCRPVLGSDIGGTAEKIGGRGGITFAARSESSMASLMERCISNAALHQGLLGQMQEPTTATSCLASHLSVYSDVFQI
jgi:glycosyltransferase involved in cell wall biosynthesis